MRVESIILKGLLPFSDATINFDRAASQTFGEVHLLVGQNGTGKTRLLCLLAAACGNATELAHRVGKLTDIDSVVVGRHEQFNVIWPTKVGKAFWHEQAIAEAVRLSRAGAGGSPTTESLTQAQRNDGGGLGSAPPTHVQQIDLPTAMAFRGMARISDANVVAMAPINVGTPASWLMFERIEGEDALLGQIVTNTKLSAAMEQMGEGKGVPKRNQKIMTSIEDAVAKITGRSFYFVVESTPKVALKVYWGGTGMWLRQLPDGLRSIIGWLVSCAAKLTAIHPDHEDPLSLPLILLLDEPESHLHPAWQRKILPAAQAMFPQAQIFAATHSPFIISSVNEGWIHILRADEATGVVTVDPPRACLKGDTYLDVVEDVFGMTPLEAYDPETEQLLKQFRTTLDAALGGTATEEPKLRELAKTISDRSDSLSDLVGREMHQFGRLMAQKRASA